VHKQVTVRVNWHRIGLAAGLLAAFLAGILADRGLFRSPTINRAEVPPEAVQVAQDAGLAILGGATPDTLPAGEITPEFGDQYRTIYAAVVKPMSTSSPISWTGTPVVTWYGDNYIDVAVAAQTEAGVLVLELRMVRQGGSWFVERLLSIQLREEKI
jgi:hypothetical protein